MENPGPARTDECVRPGWPDRNRPTVAVHACEAALPNLERIRDLCFRTGVFAREFGEIVRRRVEVLDGLHLEDVAVRGGKDGARSLLARLNIELEDSLLEREAVLGDWDECRSPKSQGPVDHAESPSLLVPRQYVRPREPLEIGPGHLDCLDGRGGGLICDYCLSQIEVRDLTGEPTGIRVPGVAHHRDRQVLVRKACQKPPVSGRTSRVLDLTNAFVFTDVETTGVSDLTPGIQNALGVHLLQELGSP